MGPIPEVVKGDPTSKETTVEGVYVAGDAGTMMQGAIMAASSGAVAAASINRSLVMEDAEMELSVPAAEGETLTPASRRPHPSTHRRGSHARIHDVARERRNYGARWQGGRSERFWEEHYLGHEQVWSGRPNPVLVDVVGSLPPGKVLDLGCGEGGDAVWLAEQGWRVTAADVSATALSRAAERAELKGLRSA